MTTTHTLTTSAAIGLAQKPGNATKTAAKPATKPINRKKVFELGLLAVALAASSVLVFKAAIIINYLLGMIDVAYKNFCT
jgi:hypothetical protein